MVQVAIVAADGLLLYVAGQDRLRHSEDCPGSGRLRAAGRRNLVVLVSHESLTGCRADQAGWGWA